MKNLLAKSVGIRLQNDTTEDGQGQFAMVDNSFEAVTDPRVTHPEPDVLRDLNMSAGGLGLPDGLKNCRGDSSH